MDLGSRPVLDVEMLEEVIESLTLGNKQEMEGEFNPFRKQPGEILLKDVERNYSGFLVSKMRSRLKWIVRNSLITLHS